jgi:hypothetical protein
MENDSALIGRLTFRTDEIAVGLNDRLNTPNTPETIAEYHPMVKAFFRKLFSSEEISVDPSSRSPHELIDLRVKSSGKATIAELLERVKTIGD